MRFALALPPALLLGACYSPGVPDGNDEGGSEGGSSSATADSSGGAPTTNDPTTADTSAGPTGPTSETGSSGEGETTAGLDDAPPVIEAFSVQGSQMPPEILLAETVRLAATVTDDVGVARVEFFDGGELIGVDETSPYRLDVLVTSADNGGHSYTAVAYDTVEQTAEAGPIAMSVGIDGGAVVELREEIFRTRTLLYIYGTPSVTVMSDGDVVVAGSAFFQGNGFSSTRTSTIRYSSVLSELWQLNYPLSMSAATPSRASASAPVERGTSVLLNTVLFSAADDVTENSILAINGLSGSFESAEDSLVASPEVFPRRGLARDEEDNLLVLMPSGALVKLDADGGEVWTTSVLTGLSDGPFFPRLTLDASGNAFVDIVPFGADGVSRLRKYSSDGDLLWTREGAFATAVLADGTSMSVVPTGGGSVGFSAHDGAGVQLSAGDFEVPGAVQAVGLDIVASPQGGVVVVGVRSGSGGINPRAWAAALESTGEVIWLEDIDVGSESYATGVAVSDEGRLYVTGAADDVNGALFLEVYGDAWVAELAL